VEECKRLKMGIRSELIEHKCHLLLEGLQSVVHLLLFEDKSSRRVPHGVLY